jgi:hypothetical protein
MRITLDELYAFGVCQLFAKWRRLASIVSGHKKPLFKIGEEVAIQTFYDGNLFDPLGTRAGLTAIAGVPTYGLPSGEEDLTWLPSSTRQVEFTLDADRSYFGDCIQVVNASGEPSLDPMFPPFGWSGKSLVGGYALTCSTLSGKIGLDIVGVHDGFADVQVRCAEPLRGVDGTLSTPSGYKIAVEQNVVDNASPGSRARLHLTTGRMYDLHFNLTFANSAIDLLCNINPGLVPPPLLFPGLPHAGHTMGWLAIDLASNKLVLNIIAQQFLPLGATVQGSPLRMPPSQTTAGQQSQFEAMNSSLHPFICVTAYAALNPAAVYPARSLASKQFRTNPVLHGGTPAVTLSKYQNKVVEFTCVPGSTDFGDDFALRSDELGGGGLARSPLFGRLAVQFGTIVSGKMPFTVTLKGPSARLLSKTQQLLKLLPPGTQAGLLGMHGTLRFPGITYLQRDLSLTTDPYKVSVGSVDVESGIVCNAVLRKYLFQNIMKKLLLVEPRTPTDSFCYVCNGHFGLAGECLVLSMYGDFNIPYPTGYGFPLPRFGKTIIKEGSHLQPFLNLDAVESSMFHPTSDSIEFVCSEHSRGNFGPKAVMRILQNNGGLRSIVLETEGTAYSGRLGFLTKSTFPLCSLYEFEGNFGAGRSKEGCYGFFIEEPPNCQLLMISEHERFDTWLRGSLGRING